MLYTALLAFIGVPALIAAGLMIYEIVERCRARSWPQFPALILESSAKREVSSAGVNFFIKVRYSYTSVREVLGQAVLPSRWGTSDIEEAERLITKFERGQTVLVHVHPKNPKRALFVTTIKTRDWAVGLLFFGIGVLSCSGALVAWNLRPNQPAEPTPTALRAFGAAHF